MTEDISKHYDWHTYHHVTIEGGQVNIQRVHDGAWIPRDEGNGDYLRYLEFVKKGNIPEEIDYRNEAGLKRQKEHGAQVSKWFKDLDDANKLAAKIAKGENA